MPPGLDQLVTLAAETYTEVNFRHMELLILAKLELRLAAPTPAYLLNHLIAVEEEKDWSEDLSRHMVEIVLEDHVLARQRPSRIAHAVYEAIKVKYMTISTHIYGVVLNVLFRVWIFVQCRYWRTVAPSASLITRTCGARSSSRCVSRESSRPSP